MKKLFVYGFLSVSTLIYAQDPVKPSTLEPRPVTDTYHGVDVTDNYRFLENLEDEQVLTWFKDNANYADAVMNQVPNQDMLKERMVKAVTSGYELISFIRRPRNGKLFYVKEGYDNQVGKVYYRENYDAEEQLIFDPASYNQDKEVTYAVDGIIPDHQGEKLAIKLAPDGSEISDVLVIDLEGKILDASLSQVSGVNISWLPDGENFIYHKLNSLDPRNPDLKKNTKTFLHTLGNGQDKDTELFSSATNPEMEIKEEEYPIAFYDRDIKKIVGLVVTVDKSIKLYLKEGDHTTASPWKTLARADDNVENFYITGDYIYYKTFKDAKNFKILRASTGEPEYENASVLVEEFPDEVIRDMDINKNGLYFTTARHGIEAKLWFLAHDSEEPEQIEPPFAAGDISLWSNDPDSDDLWVYVTGWTKPLQRYAFNQMEKSFSPRPLTEKTSLDELDDLVVKEEMVTSHDGVEVPLSIIHHKDAQLDGNNPVILYGYGSYGATEFARYDPFAATTCSMGVVVAIAHVRGGGELGDAWHRAGQKLNKPNTWKDAIACAEYLINEKYTTSDKLAIWGASAGGILVGRAITDRPDLFAAAVPMVGVMNPVRSEESQNGPINAPEFGTVKDPEEFKGLLEMDSYHHIKAGEEYPAVLVTSGFNDPRVVAWEPAKFAAKLQSANASENPVLFYTNFEAGHGGGVSFTETINEFTRNFAFMLWQTGHPDFQPEEKVIDGGR